MSIPTQSATTRVNAIVAELVMTGGHTRASALRHVAMKNRRLYDQSVAESVPANAGKGAISEFNGAVAKLTATGKYTRPQAVAFVARHNRTLHQQMIAESNQPKSRRRK